jgi:hypothetical protein
MIIDNFSIEIKDGILIIKSIKPLTVTLDQAQELKSIMEENTGKVYKYAIYSNCLGYFSGYDFDTDSHIYCGSLSIPRNIEKMKEYIQNGKE